MPPVPCGFPKPVGAVFDNELTHECVNAAPGRRLNWCTKKGYYGAYDCPPQGSPLTVTVPLSFVVDYYVDTVGSLTVTIERQPSASGDVCKIKQALFETTGAYAFGKGPNAGVHFYASPNPVPFDNNPGFNNDLDTFLFNYTSGTAFTKADLYTMYTAPSALLWQLTIPADQKIYLFGQAYVFVPSACTKRSA